VPLFASGVCPIGAISTSHGDVRGLAAKSASHTNEANALPLSSLYTGADKTTELAYGADPLGRFVDVEIKAAEGGWVGVGLVQGAELMVTTPAHQVSQWCLQSRPTIISNDDDHDDDGGCAIAIIYSWQVVCLMMMT